MWNVLFERVMRDCLTLSFIVCSCWTFRLHFSDFHSPFQAILYWFINVAHKIYQKKYVHPTFDPFYKQLLLFTRRPIFTIKGPCIIIRDPLFHFEKFYFTSEAPFLCSPWLLFLLGRLFLFPATPFLFSHQEILFFIGAPYFIPAIFFIVSAHLYKFRCPLLIPCFPIYFAGPLLISWNSRFISSFILFPNSRSLIYPERILFYCRSSFYKLR